MPDVQEVFRMSTQKVRQDPGAMERQHTKQRKTQRNRKVGAFALAGCIAASFVVAALVASEDRGTSTPSVAAKPGGARQLLSFVDVGSGEETAFTAPVGASGFDFTLDGSMVTYVDRDESGNSQVFVMDADGSNARQLTRGKWGVLDPEWSFDGSMIAYTRDTAEGMELFIVRMDGGSTRVTREPSDVVDPTWAPDGGSIVFSTMNAAGNHYTARSVDLTTGRTRLLVADASSPTLSPDGDRIAFDSWLKPQVRLIFANSDGSDRHIIARLVGTDAWQKWSPDGTQIAYVSNSSDEGLGTRVFDLATFETRFVTAGTIESWIDDDHILVS